MEMAGNNGSSAVRVERDQFIYDGNNTRNIMTTIIPLSNPGESLDRMALKWTSPMSGGNRFCDSNNVNVYGFLMEAYLSDTDEITLKIWDGNSAGTSANAFCWEVHTW